MDNQVFYVVFVQSGAHQAFATVELALHAQGVHNGCDAVYARDAVFCVLLLHAGDRADGLRDGSRLADAAGLNDDIVEALHGDDVVQLFHQVHLQRAADAAVLERNQTVVLLVHNPAFLNEACVNVHLADVVHDYGKADSVLVAQNAVQKGGLSAAQVSGEQQHGSFVAVHLCLGITLLYYL